VEPAGALAAKQTILWSRPSSAAVGTPNPGKAGHVLSANNTHMVAVGGMGGLGEEDKTSTTADVLDLREFHGIPVCSWPHRGRQSVY
jgi:hypothetical protein